MDFKVRNAEIFENTSRRCLMEEKLRNAISSSISKQQFHPAAETQEDHIQLKNDHPAKLVISAKRSFEAAQPYAASGKKVCVLNFASAVNPGGGVIYGASAQEESLCRCSTLYFCLEDAKMKECFYEPHKQEQNFLNNDDIIYTPDVVIFKEDSILPAGLPEEEWYEADVLTCAAPDTAHYTGKLTNQELQDIFEKRIRRILSAAAEHGAQVLILGAFGCGAFGNSPAVVADAFADQLQEYLYEFEAIEFAVFCSGRDQANYEVFRTRLQPLVTALTVMEMDGSDTTVNGVSMKGLTIEDPTEIYAEAARTAASYKGSIELIRADITTLDTECVVNAANEFLQQGGGVCGAIFNAAGAEQLQKVCDTHGHCDTGNAIITPGFHLKASYIIHAVGPVYQDGKNGEEKLLYSAYCNSLEKAKSFGIRSIAFPLISSGIYGYPKQEAWTVALQACEDFLTANCTLGMRIVFAVIDEEILSTGNEILADMKRQKEETAVRKAAELAAMQKLQQMKMESRKAAQNQSTVQNQSTAQNQNIALDAAAGTSDLMTLIRTRRSCRSFRPDPVPKEMIDSVIEAGLYAASGMNRQPVVIIAVTNKILRDKIAAVNAGFMEKENFDPFYGAPVILLVASAACTTAVCDGSLALGNMMLRAHDLGLGNCWIHRAYEEIKDDFGKNLLQSLGLEGEYEGIGHLALGWPAEENSTILPRKEGRVFYIQ